MNVLFMFQRARTAKFCFLLPLYLSFVIDSQLQFHFQRYCHYILNGIPTESILEQDDEILQKIVDDRVAVNFTDESLELKLIHQLIIEVKNDYVFSLKKAIGKILLYLMLICVMIFIISAMN